jgi:hypothetical protein
MQISNKYQCQIKRNVARVVGLLGYLFIGLLVVLPPKASAQASRSITIVPPNVQFTLDPGQKTEGTMKIINESDEPITFNASVRDYIVVDTRGTPNFLPPNTLDPQHSAAAWIGVTPSTFTVGPHQKQVLNFYVQVPVDARPGGHYAGVVYEPTASGGVKGSGASVQTLTGTLFYVSVNGPIKEHSTVAKFLASAFQEYSPVKIFTQIRNSGDLHIRPTGKIELTDSLGRKIETQNLAEHNIYPGAARDFENLFGKDMPMFGIYKASLLAAYGKNNNLPLMATVYFWVVPWKIITIIILILVALVLGVMLWRKRDVTTLTSADQESEKTQRD